MIARRLFTLLLPPARAILAGWVAILAAVYLIERPLLPLLAHALGASWFATARLAFACLALLATGWLVGRLNRPRPLWTVLAFAASLALWPGPDALGIQLTWLFQQTIDTLRDSRYAPALLETLESQTFLLGSLIAGAHLSRPTPKRPLSPIPTTPNSG